MREKLLINLHENITLSKYYLHIFNNNDVVILDDSFRKHLNRQDSDYINAIALPVSIFFINKSVFGS